MDNKKIKIIDAFIFYNELKMLYFRLSELYDTVDYFILVESTHTFSGKQKELYFQNNKEMFSKFLDKVIHIIADDMPNDPNPWYNENHQRNCIDRGIKQLQLNDNDIITITDCDEIPHTTILEKLRITGLDDVKKLDMDFYYYNIYTKNLASFNFAKILPYKIYKKYNTPQVFRHINCGVITKGGWHFSYFGDINFIKNKIIHFAHQEYNNDKYLNEDVIKKQINNCEDLFFRESDKFIRIELHNNTYLPKKYKLLLNI